MNVDTEIIPPGLDDDPDEDEDFLHVWCSMNEADGTHRSGSVMLNAESSNTDIADAMIRALIGAASMRSPALADEVATRLAPRAGGPTAS